MAIRTRSYVQKQQQPNLWLGQPATALSVVPAAAGIRTQRDATAISASPALVNPRSRLTYVELQNRGSASSAVAFVGFLPDQYWTAGQWVDATTTFTDDTVDAQDVDTNDFALETTTVSDGFVLGATIPFGAVSLDVTTAGSGTATTHTFEFWNGVAWTLIAAAGLLVDIARAVDWPSGEDLILFDPPVSWAKGGSGTGVPSDKYHIRIKRTNAVQATAALARRIYVGVVLASIDAVAANGSYTLVSGGGQMDVPDYIPFVGMAVGTADAGNNFTIITDVVENV